MPFIAKTCETCHKRVSVQDEVILGTSRMMTLTCQHTQFEEILAQIGSTAANHISSDGHKLYPFQVDGVKFIESSDARCLIADEMGLGKTVQALTFLELHQEIRPVALICKSAVKEQWAHEIVRWTSADLIQVIESASDHILPKCEFYIFSFDILRRFNNGRTKDVKEYDPINDLPYQRSDKWPYAERKTENQESELVQLFKKLNIKIIIIDECQHIKSNTAQRTIEIRNLVQKTGIKYVIALSGTPIKNSAAEYFSILNILRPEYFRVYQSYLNRWVDYYEQNGRYKYAGLRDPMAFHDYTKDFIIRREREEVLPDLPKINRTYKFSDLGEEVAEAYNSTLSEFQEYYNNSTDSTFEKQSNIMAYMSKMRHLTGIAKVEPALDFVTEFVTSCARKLVLFVHHKDVGKLIMSELAVLCQEGGLNAPQELTAALNTDQRSSLIDNFMNGATRILVASTLAAGEGLNLQKCADCVLVERQWNPANEEQAECRFIRIGQESDKVNATYLVAVGTIDEFFSELVEHKRSIFMQTMTGEEIAWDESSLIKELAEILASSGKVKWSI
jgi:SWI/SNF-related matrix-associated actin-dependent regulator 1 of chromatin subfamily A